MRLIVDEMPKKASDCMFSFYDNGYMCCNLCKSDFDDNCKLDYNQECQYLYPLSWFEVDVPGDFLSGKIRKIR